MYVIAENREQIGFITLEHRENRTPLSKTRAFTALCLIAAHDVLPR